MLAKDYPLKRSAQAINMISKSSVKIADDQVQVYPQLLIQRRIIACDNSQLEELFQYDWALHISHSSVQLPIHVKAATKASTSRCTMGKAYTRDQDAA